MNHIDEDKWIEKLREKLDNHVEPIPAGGWEKLSGELYPPVNKQVYPYKWWAVAAVAAILLLSGLTLFLTDNTVIGEVKYTEIPPVPVQPNVFLTGTDPGNLLSETDKKVDKVNHVITRKHISQRATETISVPEELIPLENQENIIKNEEEKEESVNIIPEHQKEIVTTKQVAKPSGRDKYHLPVKQDKKRNSGWSTGLTVSNMLASNASGDLSGGINPPTNSQMLDLLNTDNSVIGIRPDQELVFRDGIPYIETKEVVEIDHKQPISFGLSVRKQITDNFSVETGIVYTQLNSTISKPAQVESIKQKLHYLGIPLRGNYNFLNSERFTLYATAGGMVEKCIDGKVGDEKERVKPLQWSLTGGLGAQFNAHKNVGIYIEPGVAYFFDDGSDLETIRKDKPFNLNIQAGVRFTY